MDIEQAARIDGASTWTILCRIMLPPERQAPEPGGIVVLKGLNRVWLGQTTPKAAADDVASVANAAVASGS